MNDAPFPIDHTHTQAAALWCASQDILLFVSLSHLLFPLLEKLLLAVTIGWLRNTTRREEPRK
jgi:hypothetical protein